MADQVLINPKLYVNQFDWSGDIMALALNHGVELQDNTKSLDATAAAPATRINSGGLLTTAAEAEGVVNLGADLSDEEADALVGVADSIVTICPGHASGLAALEGEVGFSMKALISSLNRQAPVGEKFKFTMGFEISNGSLKRGTIMHDASTARSSTATGTIRQLGAVSAAQKVYASLHVLERSAGDTLDLVLQSAALVGFGSPTSRITFDQVTDANSNNRQFKEVAGAITDAFWRLSWTVGGAGASFKFVVVVSIQ